MARTRFVLDASQLDDENVGLDGISPAFTLDTSALDGSGVLDGYTFQTNATGLAGLGGLIGSASATVIHIINASGSASLGGLTGLVVAQVAHTALSSAVLGSVAGDGSAVVSKVASGSAVLGAVSGEMSATVMHSGVAVAGLGSGVATAVSSVLVRPFGDAALGSVVGSAQGTVVPQPTPTPSYPGGGNPWYRKPQVVPVRRVEEPVVVPSIVIASGSCSMSFSSSAQGQVTWSILEDEAELLLLM